MLKLNKTSIISTEHYTTPTDSSVNREMLPINIKIRSLLEKSSFVENRRTKVAVQKRLSRAERKYKAEASSKPETFSQKAESEKLSTTGIQVFYYFEVLSFHE